MNIRPNRFTPAGAARRAASAYSGRARPPRLGGPPRLGFTLFELILAIALSATLLALVGTAINLYLLRVDASRTRVEEAQLARSVLALIADDIRAASVYQPQETSAIATLIANSKAMDGQSDDDSDDATQPDGAGSSGGTGSAGTTSLSGSSLGGQSSAASSAASNSSPQFDGTLPLGVNGTLAELFIDIAELPRREEFFRTMTGYTNAPLPLPTGGAAGANATDTPAIAPPSDHKTIRYFIRHDAPAAADSTAEPSLADDLRQEAAGLVRQELPRRMRTFAEQSGNSALLESCLVLIAPEVVHLEFRYYDGQQVTDRWEMQEENSLPQAIEVRIWLAAPAAAGATADSPKDRATLVSSAHEYRQTVYLPMAVITGAQGGSASGSAGSSSFDSASSAAGANSSAVQP